MIQGEVKIIKIQKDGTERIVHRIPPKDLVKEFAPCDPFIISLEDQPVRNHRAEYTPRKNGTQDGNQGFVFGGNTAE